MMVRSWGEVASIHTWRWVRGLGVEMGLKLDDDDESERIKAV